MPDSPLPDHHPAADHRVLPIEVPIRDGMIRLGQFLKLAGIVDDGGAARELIERGEVSVAGTVETRRGRQLHVGDEVVLDEQRFVVTAHV